MKEKYLQGKNPNPLYDKLEKSHINYGISVNPSMHDNSFQNNINIKKNKSYNINNTNNNYFNQSPQDFNKKKELFDSGTKYKINTTNQQNQFNNQIFNSDE